MITTGLVPALLGAVSLVGGIVKKSNEVSEINVYVDRAKWINQLFDVDKREEAYRALYTDMQALCAKKGITPAIYYEGAPCINIPIATLVQLMDCASH